MARGGNRHPSVYRNARIGVWDRVSPVYALEVDSRFVPVVDQVMLRARLREGAGEVLGLALSPDGKTLRPASLLLAGDAVGFLQRRSQQFKSLLVDHSARCLDDDDPGRLGLGVESESDFYHTKAVKPLPQQLNSALRRAVLVVLRFTIAEQRGGRQVMRRLVCANRFFA